VRGAKDRFADLIARETGKPLWEAATEVDAVVGKVDISVSAYGERTSQRRMEGALGAKVAVRHKPHGVLAVLGPYNFPAHLPERPYRPGADCRQCRGVQAEREDAAVGALLVELLHQAGVPEGCVRLLVGGPEQGKALAATPASTACCLPVRRAPACRFTASSPNRRRRSWRWSLAATTRSSSGTRPDAFTAATIVVQSAFLSAGQRCTAARRLIVKDGEHEELIGAVIKLADRLIVDHPPRQSGARSWVR
jgi:succinylglutamic semialdehyde dehydrogenase